MADSGLGMVLGALVGLVLALTGAGGGIIAVPLLVFGLHLRMAEAAPIGLLAVGAASALGAMLGLHEGLVRYRAAAVIGLTGMLTAPLGVALAHRLPNPPLMLAFAAVLAWVAYRGFAQSGRQPTRTPVSPANRKVVCSLSPVTGRLVLCPQCLVALCATGAISGLFSGLLGVGGGFVIVPMLSRISNVPLKGVVTTSLAVIALVSLGAVTGAAAQGGILWTVALPFAVGATAALLLGRRLSAKLAGAQVQQAFSAVAAAVAVLLTLRATGLMGW